MKTLLVDMSPIFYRWIFSSTTSSTKALKLKKDENGFYDLDEYKDIYIFRTMDYISKFKHKFGVDEVVLAIDSKPYWRTDYWSGYKYGRLKNDKTGINWTQARVIQREMIDVLKTQTTFKVIDLAGVEGDDALFVLAKELSDRGHEVIAKSLDHDIIYTLANKNVKYWMTKHNSKDKKCGFVEFNQDEIEKLQYEHCFYGDKGDYILGVNAYTVFSEEFQKEYADKIASGSISPIKVWKKRHEVDMGFKEKFKDKYPEMYEKDKLSAYKQPRLGETSLHKRMIKENFTIDDFMNENPIHQMNFDLNAKIALPEHIPDEIRADIINAYDNVSITLDVGKLSKYFMDYGIIELVGKIGLF